MIKKEGYLRKYGNFMSGYKKCYLKIRGYYLIIQKGSNNKEQKTKLDLRKDVIVESNTKETNDFMIQYGPEKQKANKTFFKAISQAERDEWVQALNDAIELSQEDSQNIQSDKNPNLDPYKNNLYEAFSSKLFVDECDYDTKLSAFKQVQSMFNNELNILQDIVQSMLHMDQGEQLLKKTVSLKNLGKTMNDLIKNITQEIDNSREEMFRILESIAVMEMNKNAKKFNQKTNSAKKAKYISPNKNSFDDYNRNKSQSVRDFRPPGGFDFTGEEFKDNSDSYSNFDQRTMSMADSVFDFGSDLEEELYQDAQDEMIQQDEQLVKSKTCQLQDVFEERLTLPHLRPPDFKISIWSILKECIGKDLSRISVPVYFNEPLSMCQKIAEGCEYNDILDNAALQEDSVTRLAYVSAYLVSRSCAQFGRQLKPFNPMLGETFELVTHKYRYIAEQVSHHPPVTAFHCEGQNYQMYSHTNTATKFNGRNVVYTPFNRLYVTLMLQDGSEEKYSIQMPSTSAHNLVIGKLYIDIHGKSVITNHNTHEESELNFVPRGWSAKNAQIVQGVVKNAEGKQVYKIQGQWNDQISIIDIASGFEERIWQASERPENWDHLYHFSKFALQENYLPDSLKIKLPPTDSRLRPDQRALENGNTELATKEKHRLEESQRARRKKLEESKGTYEPAYFRQKQIDITKEIIWVFNGQYWEDRKNKDWNKLTRIYE